MHEDDRERVEARDCKQMTRENRPRVMLEGPITMTAGALGVTKGAIPEDR